MLKIFLVSFISEIIFTTLCIVKLGFLYSFLIWLASIILGLMLVSIKKSYLMKKIHLTNEINILLAFTYNKLLIVLFVIPGLLSTIIAFIMLIPWCEHHIQAKITKVLANPNFANYFMSGHSTQAHANFYSSNSFYENKEDNVIDVSYTTVDDDDSGKDNQAHK